MLRRTRLISSHLDRISLVSKGFIIWPKAHTKELSFCGSKAGDPERARMTRLGSQSEHRIRFIFSALGASHTITFIIS